ncbi:hypothetical protein [Streptosporangium roseum]|nr:hypothetical protein [Streptosporangium roseum]
MPGVAERLTGLEEALDDRGAGQVAEAGPRLGDLARSADKGAVREVADC